MLIRASIVVLVILNLGVAIWWASRGLGPLPRVHESETSVASLELLPSEIARAPLAEPVVTPPLPAPAPSAEPLPAVASAPVRDTLTAPAPAPAPAPAIKPAATPEQCLSLGPFADRSQAEAALSRVSEVTVRARVREIATPQTGSYRVWIPPAASREEAVATSRRIVDAGLSDYYVISQGDDANAVALGQYRNREGAERRLATLKAAGFTAAVISGGTAAAANWWVDTAVLPDSPASAVIRRSGAARQQSLDCARLR